MTEPTSQPALPDEPAYRFSEEVERIGAAGVRRAQEEARSKGVPCVYSINGILHWELPDGSLTTKDPGVQPPSE